MNNFWIKLNKPIICSAPMAGITDPVFRQVLIKYGKPDVIWTEMVSIEAIYRNNKKEFKTDLKFNKNEQPVIAQVFGSKPEQFIRATKLINKLGYSGIDINMGCPDKNINKQCSGSALIQDLKLAVEIIKQVKKVAGDMPVSVKTRIGYTRNQVETWIKEILSTKIDTLIIHGRYKTQNFTGIADWKAINEVVKLRDAMQSKTIIIGNGDIQNKKQAIEYAKKYKVDGVMIGRAMLGNPWVFTDKVADKNDRIEAIKFHLNEFTKYFKETEFFSCKKHLAAYASDFDGAKKLRSELVKAQSSKQALEILKLWK